MSIREDDVEELIDWLAVGVQNGWISEPFCDTHDMPPRTTEEQAVWDEGADPCELVIRLYPPDQWNARAADIAMQVADTTAN